MSAPATDQRTPRLLLDDDEEALRDAVADLLADTAPWDVVLARTDDPQADPVDGTLWDRLARDIGVAGLAVPEVAGGAGATWREVGVVAEQLGRHVAPVPFLGSAVLATAAALHAGDPGLLERLSTGAGTAALVVPWSTPPTAWAEAAGPPSPVTADGAGHEVRLSGAVTSVVDAAGASVLLVPAAGQDGPALVAVESSDADVALRGGLDRTRTLATVTLDGAPGRLLAAGPQAAGAVETGLRTAAAVLACEQVGLADRCLETTVAYTRERHQFGRPVGSFQALKHRMADVWVANAQARAVARWAVDAVAAADPDAAVAVATAASHCSEAAVRAAEECVQMHGGIGFTWENPSHLYLKRAKADALALGVASAHRAALADLVDLPPA